MVRSNREMLGAGLEARPALAGRGVRLGADGTACAIHRRRTWPRCGPIYAAPLRCSSRKGAQPDRRAHQGALASKRASGARLGKPTDLTHAGALGRATQVAAADAFVSGLLPVVVATWQTGAQTLEAMSRALNQRGIRTARGDNWRASSVANPFVRAQTTTLMETLL